MLTTRRTQHLHRVIASSFPSAHGSALRIHVRITPGTIDSAPQARPELPCRQTHAPYMLSLLARNGRSIGPICSRPPHACHLESSNANSDETQEREAKKAVLPQQYASALFESSVQLSSVIFSFRVAPPGTVAPWQILAAARPFSRTWQVPQRPFLQSNLTLNPARETTLPRGSPCFASTTLFPF